jgi:uncharacterized protein YndB with AHSA1/START domain
MSDPTPAQAAEQQITITRVFDAPRELVFKAWTDPDHVAKWFGPAGVDTPRDSVEIDLRVGGRFNLRMVQPEIGLNHPTVTRVELQDEGGKTRMTLTDGPYPEEGGRHAGEHWEGAFDKLEALLVE